MGPSWASRGALLGFSWARPSYHWALLSGPAVGPNRRTLPSGPALPSGPTVGPSCLALPSDTTVGPYRWALGPSWDPHWRPPGLPPPAPPRTPGNPPCPSGSSGLDLLAPRARIFWSLRLLAHFTTNYYLKAPPLPPAPLMNICNATLLMCVCTLEVARQENIRTFGGASWERPLESFSEASRRAPAGLLEQSWGLLGWGFLGF